VAGVVAACSSGGDPTAAAASGTQPLSLKTSPALRPGYSAKVPDYSVRCTPGTPVHVQATVPDGQTLSVDGQPAASGSISQDVSLTPGQAFSFTVNGSETHNVRCTPSDLPVWRVERHGTPESEWIAFAPTERQVQPPKPKPYSVIVDRHGVPVWWMRAPSGIPTDPNVLPDGTVIWGDLNGPFSDAPWAHVKLDGTMLPSFDTVGVHADHHDIQELPNGNHLMIAYLPHRHTDLRPYGGPADATVFDGQVQELTPDGQLVWSWSTRGHVKLGESSWRLRKRAIDMTFEGKPAVDLIHMNSVQYVGRNLLFSGKDVNAVFLVRRSDGKILWKLGGTHRAESLSVKGDPHASSPLDGQHDARMLPDGTLTVHDNGTFGHKRLPRIVRYRINARKKTATLIQVISEKRTGHSYCCGNAQHLPGGRWLVDWGANSIIEELSGRGRRILTITLPNKLFSYRAQSVPKGVVTRAQLQAGMNAQFPR
jgi:Arylsulfotransferase (ASST)